MMNDKMSSDNNSIPGENIEIYTDGSCHTELKIGAWAAILITSNGEKVLHGKVNQTTHNRMELLAVINAVEFAESNYHNPTFTIYTDSQLVYRIQERMQKLTEKNFITKKGNMLHNSDLIKKLIYIIENHNIEFVKVKAHQQRKVNFTNNAVKFNYKVDKLVRQLVREGVRWSK